MRRSSERPGLSCSAGFLVMLAALIYLDGELVLWGLLACALHECGHWAVIVLLGGRVRALRLSAVGAEMELDSRRPLSYGREMAAALAGPAVNLILAALSAWAGEYLFAGLNLCFGLLNLLPIGALDGGRALSCALSAFSPRAACTVTRTVSVLLSGALLGLGWAAWRGYGNLTLLCTSAWLMAGVLHTK